MIVNAASFRSANATLHTYKILEESVLSWCCLSLSLSLSLSFSNGLAPFSEQLKVRLAFCIACTCSALLLISQCPVSKAGPNPRLSCCKLTSIHFPAFGFSLARHAIATQNLRKPSPHFGREAKQHPVPSWKATEASEFTLGSHAE